MAAPWERYAQAEAGATTANGPWSKYGSQAAEPPVEPGFFERMFEGDTNANKPLLERGTNPLVIGAATSIARQVGLTARAGLRGLMSIPAMVGDALGMRSTEAVQGVADLMYLHRPESATERVSQDVAGGMAGGAGFMTLGRLMYNASGQVVSRVGDMLRSQPALQTASNVTGPGAASIARESGASPETELAFGIAGTLAPAPFAYGGPEAIRHLMRGGEEGRELVRSNLQTFARSGYGTPTVGQASEARLPRAIESVLAKTPGSAGRMVDKAEEGAAGLGARIDEMASGLSGKSGAAPAGRQIKGGIKEFVRDFRETSGKLYGELDNHIAKDRPVDMTNTANALSALNADIPGAPALSEFFKNKTIQAIEGAMKSDTGEWTSRLPYEAMKKLRTLVGQEIENTSLASSVPRDKWKALYAALSKDLGEAASEAGPEAQKAFERANKHHRAGMTRIEDVLSPIVSRADPEDIFKAAVSGTKEGASTIAGVMKSLPVESRKVIAATMLRRLGRATPGQQDDLGEAFSTETFLTNWNKISPEAKTTLFGSMPRAMRQDLDKIASVAANLREGSKVFANPSGTQQAVSTQVAGGGFLVALVTGHPEVAAAIGGTALSANVTARLMTNPKFVKWLGEATMVPTGAIGAQLATLAGISGSMQGEDRAAVEDYLNAARRLPDN